MFTGEFPIAFKLQKLLIYLRKQKNASNNWRSQCDLDRGGADLEPSGDVASLITKIETLKEQVSSVLPFRIGELVS